MKKQEQVASPFLQEQPVRLGFNIMVLLLVMVVAAGVGLLAFLAVQVPAITSEFNAWMGRATPATDLGDARWAQLRFALFLYSAPTMLGIFVYGLHFVVNLINKRVRESQVIEDEEFRME